MSNPSLSNFWDKSKRTIVRFGSLGDIAADRHDVRFTLKSRHHWVRKRCQFCANTGRRVKKNASRKSAAN